MKLTSKDIKWEDGMVCALRSTIEGDEWEAQRPYMEDCSTYSTLYVVEREELTQYEFDKEDEAMVNEAMVNDINRQIKASAETHKRSNDEIANRLKHLAKINAMKFYSDEELTPKTEQEEMLVMAILRASRCQPLEQAEQFSDDFEMVRNLSYIAIDAQYRKPHKTVKKLNIPWENIKEDFNFAAMDKDGIVWIYEDYPKIISLHKRWDYSTGDCERVSYIKIDTDGVSWKESLTERPVN